MKNNEKAQGLVEFSLIIPVLIGVVLAMIDMAPLIANYFIAQGVAARGTRAAAVWYPDGTSNCRLDVANSLGSPGFLNAKWDVEIDPDCSDSAYDSNPTGQPMYVTISVDYQPLFSGTFGWPPPASPRIWSFEVTSVDQVR